MDLSEINKLNLLPKTLAEHSINIGDLITSDEFNRPNQDTLKHTYRDRALERLWSLKVPFNSNFNIFWEMFRKLVHIRCPVCSNDCQYNYGGGTGDLVSIEYKCASCGFACNFTMISNGISVSYK